MRPSDHAPSGLGFALLEVIIACAIATTVAAGATIVLSMAIQANQHARTRTMATIAAARKMEELRSLAWTHIATRAPAISMSRSDVTTDLSSEPATDDGRGLLRSPAGTLTANVDGYVDYLDPNGRWAGRGTTVPPSAVYVRRWAVQPHPNDADNLLILDVVVGTRTNNPSSLGDAIHLVSMESRK
jgi:type II secretory pathway pseudopilin PulG